MRFYLGTGMDLRKLFAWLLIVAGLGLFWGSVVVVGCRAAAWTVTRAL